MFSATALVLWTVAIYQTVTLSNAADYNHTTPAPTADIYKGKCNNTLDNCEDFGKDACTGIFHTWALDNCPRFCNLCDEKNNPQGQTGACVDKNTTICQSEKDIICNDDSYSLWAEENCKKTCQTCSGDIKTTPAPRPCTFTKTGVTYQDGEQWKDGCNKNCTCVHGIYHCLDICPKYPNSPLNWENIVKIPGTCCAIIVPGIEISCHYGGKFYYQNETWSDGCKFSCTCTNAKDGMYQCTEKCPVWSLPDVCHWDEPKPGKCCKQPVCPAPYVVKGYPDL